MNIQYGAKSRTIVDDDGNETKELWDSKGELVVKRAYQLELSSEFINAEEYLDPLFVNFGSYVNNIVNYLVPFMMQ
jgi:hypothetical protein